MENDHFTSVYRRIGRTVLDRMDDICIGVNYKRKGRGLSIPDQQRQVVIPYRRKGYLYRCNTFIPAVTMTFPLLLDFDLTKLDAQIHVYTLFVLLD